MAKREEAGSGLRAGFISEDEALRQKKRSVEDEMLTPVETPETPKPKKTEGQEDVKPEPAKDIPAVDDVPAIEAEMQGISGKKIQTVFKVVKKKKPVEPAAAEAPPVEAPVAAVVTKPAEKPVEKAAEPPVVKAEPKKAATVKPAATEPKVAAKTVKEESKPAARADVAPDVSAPVAKAKPAAKPAAVKPVEKAVPPPVAKTEEKAAEAPVAKAKPAEKPAVKAPPAAKAEAPAKSALKQPKPPAPTPLASRPAPFRPQRGNYIGREADAPMRRPAPANRPGGGGRPSQSRDFGSRPSGAAPGRRPAPSGGGFDKDREEAPRQTRSPYQSAQSRPAAPALSELGKRTAGKGGAGGRDNRRKDRNATREDRRREGNLNVRQRSPRKKRTADVQPPRQVAQLTNVTLPSTMMVKELAEMLKKSTSEVIMKLMGYGVLATLNQEIDYDTAEIVANEFGIKATERIEVTEEDILFDESEDDESELEPRPPVVVVMGHVDHGKTSILDYIRKASVATGEAGGITQHIGAYTVKVHGKKITFLDTPGHEAFTTMRARGAQVTDIAILVVAADDGVMPQTVEAINHARAANTEIIVAINKIDRPSANVDRVRQELAQHNLMSSDWGGETTIVEVSAKTGQNMEELLEMILLTADVLELKANPNRQAKGTVIEAKLDNFRGPVATLLVQRGTLHVGDTVVVSATIGNVRAMTNDRGEPIKEAGPSMPVEILGLPEVPEGGDIFYAVEDDRVGRMLAEKRRVQQRESQLRTSSRMSLDNLFSRMSEGDVQTLNIIVKGDVQGSVEAVRQSLEKLTTDEVKVNVIHGAVGAVTESDVRLAEVSDAIIIGFSVRPTNSAMELAESTGVDIRLYRVIYSAIEDIEAAMHGMLAPDIKEFVMGHAEVRNTFKITGVGTIAGCYVQDGKIQRNHEIRVVRDGIVIYEGKIASLKRFKDDVREVATGYECGIGIEKFNDVKVGDVFEAFEMRAIERK